MSEREKREGIIVFVLLLLFYVLLLFALPLAFFSQLPGGVK